MSDIDRQAEHYRELIEQGRINLRQVDIRKPKRRGCYDHALHNDPDCNNCNSRAQESGDTRDYWRAMEMLERTQRDFDAKHAQTPKSTESTPAKAAPARRGTDDSSWKDGRSQSEVEWIKQGATSSSGLSLSDNLMTVVLLISFAAVALVHATFLPPHGPAVMLPLAVACAVASVAVTYLRFNTMVLSARLILIATAIAAAFAAFGFGGFFVFLVSAVSLYFVFARLVDTSPADGTRGWLGKRLASKKPSSNER